MDILIACEESQIVLREFFKLGHNVYSCDLCNFSGDLPGRHILSDVTFLLNGFCSFTTLDGVTHSLNKRWDMIIAFPPCTYFSRVNFFNYYRNGVFNAQRFEQAKPYVDLFLKIYNADCQRICIENPLPMSLFDNILPRYTMRLQPYEYGEPFSKLTCLWLKGLPVLLPSTYPVEHRPFVPIDDNPCTLGHRKRSILRSKTFPNVARAMALQWGT